MDWQATTVWPKIWVWVEHHWWLRVQKNMKMTGRYRVNPLTVITGRKRQMVSSHVPKVEEKMAAILPPGSKLLRSNEIWAAGKLFRRLLGGFRPWQTTRKGKRNRKGQVVTFLESVSRASCFSDYCPNQQLTSLCSFIRLGTSRNAALMSGRS